MYLLQERQLKAKRPGAFYYRLPALETLDRLDLPHAGARVSRSSPRAWSWGRMWARAAWGSAFTFDPLAFFSLLAWVIYAATLGGRGRRAAGTADAPRTSRSSASPCCVLTLGAGLFLPGRHGS